MHTMSKLSTIAASATLLAALSAFGEGSTTVTFGDPVVSSGLTSISVRQPYELTGDGEITGVSLSLGNAEDSLSPSDVTPVFADGVASFELTNLPNYTTYYWQLTFRINDEGGVTEHDTEVGMTRTHRLATLKPGSKPFGADASWDIGVVPNDESTDILIDGNEGVNSAVSISGVNVTYYGGSLEIDSGDSVTISDNNKSSTQINWWVSSVTNFGAITLSGVGRNGSNLAIHAADVPSLNAQGGTISLINTTGYRGNRDISFKLDGSGNDGVINLQLSTGNQKYSSSSRLFLQGTGTFVNNGTINAWVTGDRVTSGTTVGSASILVQNADGDVTLSGNGLVRLDIDQRKPDGNANDRLSGGDNGFATRLINDSGHSIIGNGAVDSFAMLNKGLLSSMGTNGYLTVTVPFWGSRQIAFTNVVGGRIVAGPGMGMRFTTKRWIEKDSKYEEKGGWNGRFVNLGLLEARSEGVIVFAEGINSESESIAGSDLPLSGAQLELFGRVAGGGSIASQRMIKIGNGAILSPGDLANTNGTGVSTCGTLTFTGPLTLGDESVSEFQFAKADKFDSLHVGGTLKVDGTLKIVGKPHGGTFRMITSDNPITSDNEKFFAAIDLSAAEGGSKPRLKSGSETKNVTVETGDTDPDTGDPITETVEKTIYYIEATFGDGFSIIIR